MRRASATLTLLVLLIAGCGGTASTQHPLTNSLDPAFKTTAVRTIAALPFATDIADDEDPDKIAASMAEGKFYLALNAGSGFTLLPSSEVRRVLETENLLADYKAFCKKWISDQGDVDTGFLKALASHMKVDAIIVGAVDVWHQAPVDITQSGSARTSVGMLVGLFDGSTGKRLWFGRDENFKEALRYTPNDTGSELARNQTRGEMERTNLRTATGVYAPPDFPAVVDGVVASLVAAFPKRVK